MGKLKSKIRFINLLLVAIFFASSLLISFSPVVGAVPDRGGTTLSKYQKMSLQEKAEFLTLYKGFLYCMTQINSTSDIYNVDSEQATSGDWFHGAAKKTPVGHHVDPDDGEYGCDDEIVPAFLSSIGYSDDVAAAAETLLVKEPNGKFNPRYDVSRTKVELVINSDIFGGGSSNTDDAVYKVLLSNFISECGAERTSLSSGDKVVGIYVWNESNGKVEKQNYLYSEEENTSIRVGRGLPGDGGSDGKMECQTIASLLGQEKYAQAVAAAAKYYEAVTGKDGVKHTNEGDKEETYDAACEADVPILGWLICAIAELVDDFVGWVDKELKSLLTIKESEYNEGGLKTAWGAMRILATVLLVGVALFMIISQMLSTELVSAYTIKKVVPRLVIATILIQLSWFLFTALIFVTNVVGNGLADLIYAPFGGADQVGDIKNILTRYYENVGKGTEVTNAVLLSVAAIGGVAAVGGGFGLLAAALGVLVAVLIAFVVLVLRKVAIIFLLILAPLALVAWILPNTQKLWSSWWSLFSKLLLMFPMIMGLLAVGKVFAYVVAGAPVNNDGSLNTAESIASFQPLEYFAITAADDASNQIRFFIILVAYFGPYALVPLTFSLAGGIFAKATGALSNFTNRQSGRLKEKGTGAAKDWAASKYRPGGSKFRNTLAGAGAGRLAITRSQQAGLASQSKKYRDTREQEAGFLMQQKLASYRDTVDKDGNTVTAYEQQSNYLQDMGMSGDVSQRRAAVKQLMARTDYAKVENIARANPQMFDELKTDPEIAGGLAKSRTDLLKSNETWATNLNAEKLSNQDKSLHIKLRQGEKDREGNVVRNAQGHTFLEETLAGPQREVFLETARTLVNDPIRLGKLSPEDQEMYRQLAATGTYDPPSGGSEKNIGTGPPMPGQDRLF